jgi:hypothetical protein
MKLFKHGLRLFIAGSSVAGFLGGWSLLAHAPKPVAAESAQQPIEPAPTLAPLPTLEPVPSFESGDSITIQPLPQLSIPRTNFRPRLRTGGS